MNTAILLLVLAAQGERKLEFRVAVAKTAQGTWTFRVEGTTDFPDGAVLRGRGYALYEAEDYEKGGTTLDEEEFFFGNEAWQDAEVAAGKFRMEVYAFKRRPYSLPYRVRVVYDPRFQNNAVRAKAGEKKFQRHVDFRSGDEKTLEKELKATGAELHKDFLEVKALFEDLKAQYLRHQKGFERKAWDGWLNRWMDRVDALKTRNGDRLMLWTIWIERQGKLRIEGFCARLPDLASDCQEVLEGKAEVRPRTQRKMSLFLDYYAEAIEIVGLDLPLDRSAIEPALARYEKALRRLRVPKFEGWRKVRAEVKRTAAESLLALAGAFGSRKRGYDRVRRLIEQFRDLLRRADRVAAAETPAHRKALIEALETHEGELRAFKTYAGIR